MSSRLVESISSELISSIILSKPSPIQDKVLTGSVIGLDILLLFLSLQGLEDEPLPKLERTLSTSPLIPLTLLRVSVLSGIGFAFKELILGIKARISEVTKDAADDA